MNRAYRFRIDPDKKQGELINKTFGCVRFVYNKMLADHKEKYEQYKDDKDALKRVKYSTPADYKSEFSWLKEVDSLSLCNAQLNLNCAFKNFFRDKSVGFPNFKCKHRDRKSYTTNNQKGTIRIVDHNHIRLPKLGDLKIKFHRQIPSNCEIKSATISQTPTGKYYISILVEFATEIELISPCSEQVIGLDYSSKSLYLDNFGRSAEYPGYYRKMEAKLIKEQRKLSKRKKDSKNREKQRQKVAKLHEKVANQRKDFLHKQSSQIANAYDAVVVEDLNMRGMAQGLNLAKSTNDNGFGMFRRYLDYKLKEQGKQLVVIDKWYPSSKTCHACGEFNDRLTLADRIWTCACGVKHDRDINAAINIKNEGCRILGIA